MSDLYERIKELPPEKRALRLAFTGWLPDEFLWREKQEFGDGSGAASALEPHYDALISDEELDSERQAAPVPIRSKQELAYYRIFCEHLPGVRPAATLGSFATA